MATLKDMMTMGLTPKRIEDYLARGNASGNTGVEPGYDSMSQPAVQAPQPQPQPGNPDLDVQPPIGTQHDLASIDPVAGINHTKNMLEQYLNKPAIDPKIEKAMWESINAQKAGIPEFGKYQQALAGAPVQTDISPLMAYIDSTTGSKLSPGYTKPTNLRDQISGQEKIQTDKLKQQDSVTDALVKLAGQKTSGDWMKLLGQETRDKRLNLYETSLAQKAAEKVDKDLTTRTDGFARMKDLFNNATDKSVAPEDRVAANNAFRSMLVQEQLRLETGARTAASVGEQREAHYLSQKMKELAQSLGNKPLDTIPEGELRNSGNILDVMGKSYLEQADRQYNQLKSRATPVQREVFENSHKQFLNSYAPILGTKVRTSGKVGIPTGVDPADWAKATPEQQQEFLSHIGK